MLQHFSERLARGENLRPDECEAAVDHLVSEAEPAASKAAFLCDLALKGETVEEIAAFAGALRAKSVQPALSEATRSGEILDVCGTGGDRLNTFNISTTVAIICSAAGIAVAKHGNRAITSQAGSADVLEALGVRIDLSPAEAAQSLAERNFAFFFAPNYHPAFRFIAPARKLCADRGQRTIFNFLGPLLNPARPTAQLVGVPRPSLCEPLAQVLQRLGVRRAMVVSGKVSMNGAPDSYLDELSILGDNTVAEFYQERGFTSSTLSPEGFSPQAATLSDLTGGDRAANAEIVRAILDGKDRGLKRDSVLFNAAAALMLAGRSRTLADGWDAAAGVIDSGRAREKLSELAS
ncbi:MAG TPA: anthranilate phosphoribosyltransferase [Verrucomicrobiae bacterium]|nr:anthranilate phosphoribosyltransferase [Verrucomicrobiae bacterium]